MRRQSNARFVILVGMLATAALWTGTNGWFATAVAQQVSKTKARISIVMDRKPIRVVSDPNPVFSGIAIDEKRGEVFMTNDKESADPSIVVYPTQFAPTEKIMEPRRRLAGPNTQLQLPCGVAISPEFQEMYAVSGDGQEINVFSLMAQGNSAPARQIDVPHASGGVSLDPKHNELYITTEHSNRISVFHRTDVGDADPLRFIQGPHTALADPHGIYVDPERNEIFVTNHGNWRNTVTGEAFALTGDSRYGKQRGSYSHVGVIPPLGPSSGKFLPPSITVYSRNANGDAAPLRTIGGPHTRLNVAIGISRDPVSGEIVVANSGDNSVLFFAPDANGDAPPTRVLQGSATNLKGPTGTAIDAQHNELWVTSWENHIAAVYPRTANGNVAPLRVIHSAPPDAPSASMGRLGAVEFDPKRKEILMPN